MKSLNSLNFTRISQMCYRKHISQPMLRYKNGCIKTHMSYRVEKFSDYINFDLIDKPGKSFRVIFVICFS